MIDDVLNQLQVQRDLTQIIEERYNKMNMELLELQLVEKSLRRRVKQLEQDVEDLRAQLVERDSTQQVDTHHEAGVE